MTFGNRFGNLHVPDLTIVALQSHVVCQSQAGPDSTACYLLIWKSDIDKNWEDFCCPAWIISDIFMFVT